MSTPRPVTCLTLAVLLAGAAGVRAQTVEEAPRGQLLNGVQLIVNNDCITSTDLLRLAQIQSQGQIDPSQLNRLMQEGANQMARTMLMQQAGKDLGYDPKMVESMVRSELNSRKERIGSITALAEIFEEARKDSASFKEETENDIYGILWRRSVSGIFIGPGGRPYVDRYVRPGQLELEFKRLGSSLDLPRKVRMQEIIIASEVGEDLAGARQRAMLVRGRARRGEDFEALNIEFGFPARVVDGVPTYSVDLDPIEESKLSSVAEVREFVANAAPGDISEPLPAAAANGVVRGFRLLRFVERIEGVAKSFQDQEFQTQLRKAQVQEREDMLVERGLGILMSAAYIWPPELAKRPGDRGVKPVSAGSAPPPAEPSGEAAAPAPELPAESPVEAQPEVSKPDVVPAPEAEPTAGEGDPAPADPQSEPVEKPVEKPAEKPADGGR